MVGLDVVNAALAEPLLKAIPFSQARLEGMLEKRNLPIGLLERPEGLIPLYSIEGFLNDVSRATGAEHFNFDCLADSRLGQASVANVPLVQESTNFRTIQRFVRTIDSSITGATFRVVVENDLLWLLRSSSTTSQSDHWGVVQYNLAVLLRGMQRMFGSDIIPVAIQVTDRPSGSLPEHLSHAPLFVGTGKIGLGFGLRDIVSRNHLAAPDNPVAGRSLVELRGQDKRSVTQCMMTLISSTPESHSLSHAAAAFGLGKRSYQRRLDALGVTHRELVGDARLKLALRWLSEPRNSITDIAFGLGYRFPADFTRFFKAQVGVSPEAYRKCLIN